MKGNTSLFDWLNAIYYDSVVDRAISVCNLLQNNTGQFTYMRTYLVLDNTASGFPESALSQPPAKSSST